MRKTLIVSPYAPPSNSGSALMMYNILSYLPQDKLAILTSEENTDPEVQQYRLKVPYYYYGNKLLALKFNDKQESFLQRFKRALKSIGLVKFFAQFIFLFSVPRKIVKIGQQAVKEQNIELLLGYSDWGMNLLGIYLLHKKTGKPFSLHFYDLYIGNKMPWAFRLLSYWLEPRLFKSAKKISVMCEELQKYYQNKYHREVFVVHNSIIFDPENLPLLPSQKPVKEKFRIAFLGNIYWAQQQAVTNMVQAVNGLNDPSMELVLYTPHSENYLRSIGIEPNEKIKFSFCPPEKVLAALSQANLLFLGLSFNTNYPQLINTSSPGKLCDYLIAGTPILAHAGKDSFLVKYIKEHNLGFVAEENNIESIKETIERARNGITQVDIFVKNSWQIALLNHQAKTEAAKLLSLLSV